MTENVTRELMEEVVKNEIAYVMDVEAEASLVEDHAMDSLDALEFVMGVEEETGVDISDEDAEKWKTGRDVVKYLEGAMVP